MKRQFRLRCKQITDVQRAFEWSNYNIITTETGYYEITLSQPEEGSEKLKPWQCPHCGEMLKVTVRSEADAKKRGIFLRTAFAIALLIAAGLFYIMFQAKTDAIVFGSFISACISILLAGVFLYFSLPSQLRATLYDKDGNSIMPGTEWAEHELEEIRSANS